MGGTIKAEIVKPLDDTSWEEFGARIRVLRGTVAEALTLTMRQLYPEAIGSLDAIRHGKKDKLEWKAAVEPVLREHWNEVVVRRRTYDLDRSNATLEQYKKEKASYDRKFATYEKKRDRGLVVDKPEEPKKPQPFFESAYLPVQEALTAETADNLKARWTGEPLKDLLASRASVPSWRTGCAFFVRSRVAVVEGDAKNASVELPLWPKRHVRIAVAPCGNGHRALWRRLVRGESDRRKLHEVAQQARDEAYKDAIARNIQKEQQRGWVEGMYDAHVRAERAAANLTKTDSKNSPEERQAELVSARNAFDKTEWAVSQKKFFEAQLVLDGHPGLKLGKIGISYDVDKRKWFALITWTCPAEVPKEGGIKATCNLGVNVFLRAVTEDSDTYEVQGHQVVAVRRQFQHRRKTMAESLKAMSSGASGHGYQRKMLPLTKLEAAEQDAIRTFIGQQARAFVNWCADKNVTTVYLEDYKGARQDFEAKTEGEAHEEVKRFIHNFPHYQWRQAVERAGAFGGQKLVCLEDGRRVRTSKRFPIKVETRTMKYQNQRCPCCGFTSPENYKIVPNESVKQFKSVWDGNEYVTWQHTAKKSKFSCKQCGRTGDGDLVAAVNFLVECGSRNPGADVLYLAEQKSGEEELAVEVAKALNGSSNGSNGKHHQPEAAT